MSFAFRDCDWEKERRRDRNVIKCAKKVLNCFHWNIWFSLFDIKSNKNCTAAIDNDKWMTALIQVNCLLIANAQIKWFVRKRNERMSKEKKIKKTIENKKSENCIANAIDAAAINGYHSLRTDFNSWSRIEMYLRWNSYYFSSTFDRLFDLQTSDYDI